MLSTHTEIHRCCKKQVPGLVELAKAGAACAVTIHHIRARKRSVVDAAIQATRHWATDVAHRVQRQQGVSRDWADTDNRPAVRGAISCSCSCKRAGISILRCRCHAVYDCGCENDHKRLFLLKVNLVCDRTWPFRRARLEPMEAGNLCGEPSGKNCPPQRFVPKMTRRSRPLPRRLRRPLPPGECGTE
jgi:hypothetical protein